MHPIRLVSLSLALAAAFGAPARAQSLLELVQSASEIDSSWQSARAQLDAAEGRAGQARAGLLPSAGLSAGWSVADTQVSRPPVGAHPVTQSLAISASQPLFRPANAIAYQQGKRARCTAELPANPAAILEIEIPANAAPQLALGRVEISWIPFP